MILMTKILQSSNQSVKKKKQDNTKKIFNAIQNFYYKKFLLGFSLFN